MWMVLFISFKLEYSNLDLFDSFKVKFWPVLLVSVFHGSVGPIKVLKHQVH